MKTELELEFKALTGFRPKLLGDITCHDCGDLLVEGEFYTSDYVDFLISKIETYENSNRNTKRD